jgi:hypothetical protein
VADATLQAIAIIAILISILTNGLRLKTKSIYRLLEILEVGKPGLHFIMLGKI